MDIHWQALLAGQHKWLKAAGLSAALAVAVYGGAIRPSEDFRGIANSKATGLAAIERNRHWLVPVPQSVDNATLEAGIVGGVPREGMPQLASAYLSTADALADRKLIRTSSISLLVKHPAESADQIRSLVEGVGGFLVKSQTNGAQDSTSASLSVRVPAARFAEVEAEICKLGLRVENEQIEAEDVTRQYVDQQAHLRNLHAQEAQYLTILKSAKSVKDTLEVSEKLNEVTDEIEKHQAEFEVLSKQVETVAIGVYLHSQAEANVFGLHWRASYELKIALIQGLEGLADYATAMFSLVLYLPAILLWLVTVLVGAALGWKALRLGVRVFFPSKKTVSVAA